MSFFFEVVALAAIYGLYACGLTLVFGILEVLNLAHAATFTVAVLFSMYLSVEADLPLWLCGVGAVAGGALVGILVDRIAFWPLRLRGKATAWGRHIGPLLSSLAVASILEGGDRILFGLDPRHYPNRELPQLRLSVGSASVQAVSLAAAVAFTVIVVMLTLWLRNSRWGVELRAVAQSQETASLFGINSERRFVETMALSGALAGLAGLTWGLTFNIASPDTAAQLDVKGFALIVLGGMGSVPGSLIGAAVIAAIEVSGVRWLPHGSEHLLVFAVLFLVLVARPQGFLGRQAIAGAR